MEADVKTEAEVIAIGTGEDEKCVGLAEKECHSN